MALPAAEDPRIFDLLRPVGQDELRQRGLEVESRPERSYPRWWPGDRRADPVRLDYHGVGLLQVATHAHEGISTRGLGLMFPAHTVHARDSTAAVVGNGCELTQVDHVHIRQAVIADDALRSRQVERVLAEAVPGGDNSTVVRDLRATLTRLVDPPVENGPQQAELKLRADCTAEIYDCESVQLGDDAMTRLDSHFVVERTVIPAGALLADSEDLARRYVDVVTGTPADPGALADFLCDLVGAAENTTDDNILGYADGLPRRPATLLGLFGMASIDAMTSIMIGTGNELHTELDLTTARTTLDASFTDRLAQSPPPTSPDRPSPGESPPPQPGPWARWPVPPSSSPTTSLRPPGQPSPGRRRLLAARGPRRRQCRPPVRPRRPRVRSYRPPPRPGRSQRRPHRPPARSTRRLRRPPARPRRRPPAHP
ncbi:hypothetical protein [Actinoplanes sp. CA-252034]|uniref:hypothetical protein n=1 Tax=Actinoplanes sp. CA-252034 TaxID=3239906 RepID=UPI003D956328